MDRAINEWQNDCGPVSKVDGGITWKSAQVVNSHLMCDPTIWQPGLDLPRQQGSLLNRFRTEQWHCGACRRKWWLTDTDLCPCGETLTMSHIVESCSLTKLYDGLSRLHSANEDAVSWLTSYGSWHAYKKKKKAEEQHLKLLLQLLTLLTLQHCADSFFKRFNFSVYMLPW